MDILIRPCSTDDAPALYEAVRESLSELIPWMPWCHPDYAMEEARSWLRTQVQAFNERKWFGFAIVDAKGRDRTRRRHARGRPGARLGVCALPRVRRA